MTGSPTRPPHRFALPARAGRAALTLGRQAAYYLVQYAVDVRYGMVTRDVVAGGPARYDESESRPHEPSPARQFLGALRSLRLDPAGYVFVDLGSGKGAALVLAAKHGYGRLVGVEIDPRLMAVARRNVAALRRRRPDLAARIELREQDATRFQWPAEPTVAYLFNPFGRQTLAAVLGRIEESLRAAPRPFLLVYLNPVLHHILDASAELRLVCGQPHLRVYASRTGGPAPHGNGTAGP